jgi:hypothetical protein
MTPERELDVAFALEGVACVAGAHALTPAAAAGYELAVVVRPMGGVEMAEAHYRLLDVLSHEECGRILWVDGDAPEPLPMRGARRLIITPAKRNEVMVRALARVEQTARRYEEEEQLVAQPTPMSTAVDLAIQVSAALADDPRVKQVAVVERRLRANTAGVEVLVATAPFAPLNVVDLHRQLLLAATLRASGRVAYADASLVNRCLVHPICATVLERHAAKWRAARTPDTSPEFADAVIDAFAAAPCAVALSIGRGPVEVTVVPLRSD